MAVLSPASCFSLERFVCVVKKSLSGSSSGLASLCPVPGTVEHLCHQLLSQVLLDYGPCLSQRHTQVLRLLLCVGLLQHSHLCSEAESWAFLLGPPPNLRDLPRDLRDLPETSEICPETSPDPSPALPLWIPAQALPQLQWLEQDPAFRGLCSSLSRDPELWKEYLGVSSPFTGPVPLEPFTQLSLLQRALLWRTLRPDCLHTGVENISGGLLTEGPHALSQLQHTGAENMSAGLLTDGAGCEVHTLVPGSCSNTVAPSSSHGPLTLPVSLRVLCSWKQASIVSALKNSPNEGLWLVFKNIHLLEQWDKLWPELKRRLLHLKGLRRLQLWFTVPEDKVQLIPFAVRLRALVLVLDSCWTLQEQVQRSEQQVALSYQPGVHECVLFHSVLLQRQTEQQLFCPWTETDLQVLLETYKDLTGVCRDHERTLQYLAVSLVHGAHVLDVLQSEELRSVACVYLCPRPNTQDDGLTSLQMFPEEQDDSSGLCLGFGHDVVQEILQKKSHSLSVLLQASQSAHRSVRDMSTEETQAVRPVRALETYMRTRTGPPADSPPAGPLQAFLQGEWDALRSILLSPCCSELQLQDVQRRAEFLSSYLWHQDGPDPAHTYRLSAFSNPKAFLLALRRHHAKVQRRNVSDISLVFQVLGDDAGSSSCPADAVFLCGLELRGAVWDPERGGVSVPDQSQSPGSSFPLLCVAPSLQCPCPPVPLSYLCPVFAGPGGARGLGPAPVPSAAREVCSETGSPALHSAHQLNDRTVWF
ncbi:hypothetical protein WMY93_005484 [Mugilogobius chulae]|uniref:Dynein heavy chain C-terminal domain-containing protein n=1 Tax=Mugilogobius chulae TaxID=88201 RepID=A0AAW0PR31_9GOBI